MKKLLLMLIGVLLALPALAYDFTYTYEGQTLIYTVLDYEQRTVATKGRATEGTTGEVKIPSKINDVEGDFTVVAIDDRAFINCTDITSVTIPNSVVSIGQAAFLGCIALPSIIIPESVTEIGSNTFSGCSGLVSVKLPQFLTTIENHTFYNCSKLVSLEIPPTVASINSYAFSGCSALTSIELPNSLSSIQFGTFSGCTSLKSIIIPNTVTRIHGSAFSGCSGLISVTIPKSVTSIEMGYPVFSGCSALKKAAYPNNLPNPFKCESVFAYNPKVATTVNGYVYLNNDSEIFFVPYLPDAQYQLSETTATIGERAFEYLDNLVSIVIPDNVATIKASAFQNCENLRDVILPLNLEVIGEKIFENCGNIKHVVYRGPTPVAGSKDVFDLDVYKYAVLYVRSGRQQQFMEVSPWNYFFNITDKEFAKLMLNLAEATVAQDETLQLLATVVPASDNPVVWTSSNPAVATVSEDGLVSAVAEGSAIISAACGDVSATCTITVTPKAGIDEVAAEPTAVEVYSLSGIIMLRDATETDLDTLAPGIYIVRRGSTVKKIVVR